MPLIAEKRLIFSWFLAINITGIPIAVQGAAQCKADVAINFALFL